MLFDSSYKLLGGTRNAEEFILPSDINIIQCLKSKEEIQVN